MIASRRRDAAWASTAFAVQYVAVAARAMVLTRLLSPPDVGLFFVFRGIAGVAGILTLAGLGQTGLRRVAAAGGDTPEGRAILRHVIRMALAITPAVACATSLTMWLAGASAADAVLTAALASAIAWTTLLGDLARGLGRVVAVAVIERIAGSVLDVAALTALKLAGDQSSLTAALAVSVLAALPTITALAAVVARGAAQPGVEGILAEETAEPVEGLVAESWPVTANAMLWRVLTEVDLWIVAALGGAEQAALYGIASRVAALLQAAQAIAVFALSGPIASLHAQGRRHDLERMLKRTARRAATVTAAGYLAVLIIGERGLALAFGETYAGAMPLIVVMGASQVFSVAAGLGGTTLVMMGRSRTLLRLSLISTLTTAAGAITLMPRIGTIGVAIASAVGVILQNVLAVRAVKRHAGLSIHAGPRRGPAPAPPPV